MSLNDDSRERRAATEENERRGALVAAAKARLAFEEKFWCSDHRPPRLVAAVVVFNGERCLFIPGGVDQQTKAEVEKMRAGAEASRRRAADAPVERLRHHHLRWAEGLDQHADRLAEDQGSVVRPWAAVLGPVLDADAPDEWENAAVCPHCHRGYRVTTDQRRAVTVRQTLAS